MFISRSYLGQVFICFLVSFTLQGSKLEEKRNAHTSIKKIYVSIDHSNSASPKMWYYYQQLNAGKEKPTIIRIQGGPPSVGINPLDPVQLIPRFQFINFDQRGSSLGLNAATLKELPLPLTTIDQNIQDFLQVLYKLKKDKQLGPYIILGMSYGTILAQALTSAIERNNKGLHLPVATVLDGAIGRPINNPKLLVDAQAFLDQSNFFADETIVDALRVMSEPEHKAHYDLYKEYLAHRVMRIVQDGDEVAEYLSQSSSTRKSSDRFIDFSDEPSFYDFELTHSTIDELYQTHQWKLISPKKHRPRYLHFLAEFHPNPAHHASAEYTLDVKKKKLF